jgi:hypothetical protein
MSTIRMVGFTGHAGLPPATVELVERELREKLAPYRGPELVGVSLLGPGCDQLFARIILELGGNLCVVVPAKRYREQFTDPQAQQTYDQLYRQCAYFEELEYLDSTEEAHMAAGRVVVEQCTWLLAVWDGKPSKGLGGTADVVAYARERVIPVEVIWPEGATRD